MNGQAFRTRPLIDPRTRLARSRRVPILVRITLMLVYLTASARAPLDSVFLLGGVTEEPLSTLYF